MNELRHKLKKNRIVTNMAKTEQQTDPKWLFDAAAAAETLSKWKLAWHSEDLRAQGIGFIDIALYIIYVYICT